MIEHMHKKKVLFKPLFKDANASLVKCRNGCQIESIMKQDLILDRHRLSTKLFIYITDTQTTLVIREVHFKKLITLELELK